MKIYLAHATKDMKYVRRLIQPKLKEIFDIIINPFDYEHWEKDNESLIYKSTKYIAYKIQLKRKAYKTVERDLQQIDECDGIVAFIRSQSVGLFMELFYGYMKYKRKKPIYIILHESKHILSTHPWLLTVSDKIFKNVDELIKYVRRGNGE